MSPPHDVDIERELIDGRYRLRELVGVGGYARVYRADDEHLGRVVAVKIFSHGGSDDGTGARRASETRLLASFAHPSLVTLYDANLDDDPAYLVMEFIDGPPLSALLASGPIAAADVARHAGELAEALHVIHDRGVVHRDVKPSNVLLRRSVVPGGASRATLADFGIARLVDSTRVTAAGSLVGTAAYLSPEQARGEDPTSAADVYALGLVLLEALTGRRAFPQTTPHEALAARLVAPPAIPATLDAGWRTLLSAMTAQEAAHRPDAHAVLRAAERLRGTHETAEPASSPPPTAPLPPTPPLPPTLPLSAENPAVRPAGTRRFDGASTPSPVRTRRWLLPAAIAVTAVVLVGIAALVAAQVGASPDPRPTLPSLPAPVDDLFRQLWDEVGP